MSPAEALNRVLADKAPALAACLSPLGRAVVFPKGIPFQADQARGKRLNGTIGQVTDGAGNPMPLPILAETVPGLDPKVTFLYSPQPGHKEVRDLWRARQLHLAGRTSGKATVPFATHGLSHGLGLVADLFADADTTIVVPSPSWENYELVFTMRTGAKVVTYPFFDGDRFNLDGLGAVLDGLTGKAIVVLNFPSNPTGYAPTEAEAAAITARLAAHAGPAVIVVDDAYQGVVHEPGRLTASLYWQLADALDPARAVAIKVDGATKELMFFPSRMGFLMASLDDAEAEAAWLSKLNCIVRGTVGGPPGPSQAMMLAALRDPARTDAEFGVAMTELTARYRALQDALAGCTSGRLFPRPFNGAFFALVGLADGIDPEVVRQRLLAERSVGLIAIPEDNALRIAYCSTRAEDVAEIVRHLDEVVASM
ncbi:MAG: aminotransferase class I/II-fold pyridoxal phosphate-dependent enzyme [Alphaproteobacteria bacterium]|nr:aminotransferase class I/II-fold pyridoxal phosphate-dependent enzyme [Alphaproteobacteria bacterium]